MAQLEGTGSRSEFRTKNLSKESHCKVTRYAGHRGLGLHSIVNSPYVYAYVTVIDLY